MDINKHKFHGKYRLSGYKSGIITVNNIEYKTSLIIDKNNLHTDWSPQSTAELTGKHFEPILSLKPEIVILGTGMKHQFISDELLETFYNEDIPVEVMSTQKACMLFPVLLDEQRHAIAALMP